MKTENVARFIHLSLAVLVFGIICSAACMLLLPRLASHLAFTAHAYSWDRDGCALIEVNMGDYPLGIIAMRLDDENGERVLDRREPSGRTKGPVTLCAGLDNAELRRELTASGWSVATRPGFQLQPGVTYQARIRHKDVDGWNTRSSIPVTIPLPHQDSPTR